MLLVALSFSGFATTYYYQSGTFTAAGSWNTNPAGGGTAATVFTNSADIWVVRTALTMNAAWTVAGQLWIGDGATANTVTITTNPAISGGITVKSGAVLAQNAASTATNPNMASVQDPSSTINYGGTTSHVIPVITFGYLTISSTGSSSFVTGTTNIAADFNHTAGALVVNTVASSLTVNISGNCNLTGGSMDFCNASGSGVNTNIYLAKNLTISGSYTVTTSGGVTNGQYVFNGTGTAATPQIFTISNGGTLIWTNIVINSGTYMQMAGTSTVVTLTGSTNLSPDYRGTVLVNGTLDTKTTTFASSGTNAVFTVNGGATLITAVPNGLGGASAGVVGSSNWTNSFNASANYVFNGSAAQITGTNLPAAISSGSSVTINNAAGVTLSQTTIFNSASILNLVNGTFTNTASNLQVNSGVSVNCDNGNIAVAPTTYSGINLTYMNLGNNAAAVTTGNEWPATFTGTVVVNKASSVYTLNNAKSLTGSLTLTAGALDASASNYNLSLTGNWNNNSGTTAFTARTATVTFNGSSSQSIGGTYGTTFNGLTLNNSAGATTGVDQYVNGTLTITSGKLNIGTHDLILGTSSPAVAGSFSSANMIIANGGGQVKKMFSANGSYLFPIGDNTSIYSPITLNVSGSAYSSAYVGVKVTKAKQPMNVNVSNYLNRYWSVATSGITSPSYSVTGATYTAGDVTGTEANISMGQYPGSLPWHKFGATNTSTHTLTSTAVTTATSDFTGITTANPVATISAGTAICPGNSTSLSVSTFTADPSVSYSWAPGASLSSVSGTTVTATPTVTTTYTMTVTDGNGFTGTATSVVTVNALPAISAGSGVAICNGSSTTLTASGGSAYSWSPSTGLSVTTGASVTANPSVTTVYTVTGAAGTGCSNTATVTVTVNALPAISAGSNVAICNGSSTILTATGGTTYFWSPSTGLSATTGASITANPITTTTYTVTGTNASGCSSSATVTVTVNSLPAISAGSGVAICNGSSTALTATGGTTYTWVPATGLSASTGTSVTASPSIATTYTVTGTTGARCSSTATVTVTVNSNPVISAGSGLIICSGTSSPAITPAGGVSYSWAPATGLSSTTGSVVFASPLANTVYTITGTDLSGCSGIATVAVSVNPMPVITAAPGSAICTGSSATISASGGLTYSWLPSTGLSSVTGSSVTATPVSTTTYTVTGTNSYGCSASSTETITVNTLPVISAGAGFAICNGSSTLITATGGATYSWSPATGLSASTGAGVSASPVTSTVYTVTGTNIYGCNSSASVTVTVNALPVVTAGPSYSICSGNSTPAISATGGVSYTWSPSTGLSSTTASSAIANPLTTTVYTVTGTDLSGCTNNAKFTVSVNPAPSISAGSGATICTGSSTILSATGGATYMWSPSIGLSATTGSSVTASPVLTTVYTVTGINVYGCQSNATVAVTVHAVPGLSVGSGVTICNGTSGIISASGAIAYNWAPTTGLSATTGNTVTANPSSTTTYTVTGTNVFGCSNTATVSVSVNASPSITSVSNGGVICSGNTLTLSSAATGGTGSLSYSWSGPGSYTSSLQNTSITAAPATASGVYSLTVTDANSCSATGVTTATVNPTPSAGTITGSSSVCVGNTISVADTATGGIWSAGSGMVTIGSSTGIITGVAIGSVNITYSVTNMYSCNSKAIKSISVAGLPNYLYTGAGTGANTSTGDGGPAYLATLMGPRALCSDTSGNVYIADVMTNTIRKISTNGYISTVVGNGVTGNAGDGGPATAAQLSMSGGGGLYVDKAGNIFISNTTGMTIRKVTASTGIISTICGTTVGGYSGDGGPASAAKVQGPLGICEDTSGNIYFADGGNNRIRRIDAGTGIITTIIGTGSGAYSGDGGLGISARVYIPRDVMADIYGNLYVADYGNNVIRKYVIATGIVTTLAGTGTAGSSGDGGAATSAQLYYPARLAFDGSNNLYIADQFNNKVRKVNLSTGIISTGIATGTSGFSGDGGPSTLGKMTQTGGIAITKNGHIYVSDITNRRIRVSPYNGSIAITLAGPTTIVAGTPVTFTANPSISGPYVTMQWLKNGTAIGSGGKTFTDYSPSNGDIYKCILQVAPDCGTTFYDTSNSITISLAGYRTADTAEAVVKVSMEQSEIKVFPNPVHGQLNIEGTNLENGPMQISVYDRIGRMVISKTTEVVDGRMTEQLDMQSLAEGMYLVTLTDNAGNSKTVKCVKN